MEYNPKWYKDYALDIPTFQDLQNVTGQVFDDYGNYIGKQEAPKQQLVIDKNTKRQYFAPMEYNNDAVLYAKAKIDESFDPEEWYGMTKIKPNYTLGEHISAGYIAGLKTFTNEIAQIPTKLVYSGVVGLNAIYKGELQSQENLYRASMKAWDKTLEKAGFSVDDEIRNMLTVRAGELVGQTASSLFVAAAVSQVGGLPAVAAVFGSTQFADVMEESLAKGIPHNKAVWIAFQSAVAEGGLEALGFKYWASATSVNKSFKNIALGFLWEGTQEASQQIAESAITNFYGVRSQKLTDILAEVALSFMVGGLVGGAGVAVSGQIEPRNMALRRAVGMDEQGRVTPKAQQASETPQRELPPASKEAVAQELEDAKKAGNNQLYNLVKYIANANGVTEDSVIDKLYPVARKMVSDGATLDTLTDILSQQLIAYNNQLDNGQVNEKANEKAVEQIRLATDPARIEEWRESRKSELEKAGFTKEQANTLSEHLTNITQRLSERLGFDITQKKGIVFEPNLRERAGTRGQIELGKTVAKVALNKNADPTTVEHEFFHYVDRVVLDAAKEGNVEAQKLVKKRDEIIKKAKAELKKQGIKDMPIDEEILASAYEKWLWNGAKSTDATEQKLFDSIRQFFKDVYEVAKGLMGIRITPEADAYFRAMTGADTMYQPRQEVSFEAEEGIKEQVKKDIEDYENGTMPKGKVVSLGFPSAPLLAVGVPNFELNLKQKTIKKDTKTKHKVKMETFKNLPSLLADPLLILKSDTETGSFIAVLNDTDKNGKRVIAAIDPEGGVEINYVDSVYGKDNKYWFKTQVEKGNLLYIDENEALKESSHLYLRGVPYKASTNSILTKDDIVKGETLFQKDIKYKNGKADINSPEFKKWFGDSKVVDENGKPLVVYHGTPSKEGISIFDKSKIGTRDEGEFGKLFYFTANEDYAKIYSKTSGANVGYVNTNQRQGQIIPVYIKLENPRYVSKLDSGTIDEEKLKGHDGIILYEAHDLRNDPKRLEEVKKEITNEQYLLRDFEDNIIGYKEMIEIGVKEPNQIKSVYNRGTFDTESPNIYYQSDNKDLIATHSAKLSHIDEILKDGRLIAPSMAITKKGQKELNTGKFGEVVLVLNPINMDYRYGNVYNRDIYSPRFPSPVYKTEGFGYISQSEYDNYQRKWEENPDKFKKDYGGTFDELVGNDKYIFEGFHPRTEKRIYKKYTPENVLAYLKKESLLGGESFHYGLSSFLSKMSKQIKSREELRQESKKLSNREDAQKRYDELSKRYGDLLYGEIRKYRKFADFPEEDFDAFLKDNYEGHPERAEEYLKVDEIPDSLKMELKDFVEETLSLPRSYFEMKPMRLVPLNNFVYAVTKKGNLSKEQITKFESYGVEVKEVDSIKDFDFTSLEMGRENATNAFDVYFQQEINEQLYRNDQALKEGAKVLDKAPTNAEVENELSAIEAGQVKNVTNAEKNFGIQEFFGDILLTVRQRVGVIDKRLKYAFDRMDFDEKMRESQYGKRVVGFIRKYRKLDDTQKKVLDYLIGNKQTERIREFCRKNDMLTEYLEVRTLLDELFAEGNKAGMDMGFLDEYFPTKVNDYNGLISYLMGTDKWSEIQRALHMIDPKNQMSEEDKANVINNILRGMSPRIYMKGEGGKGVGFYNPNDPIQKQGFQKERKIFHKTPEMMEFYAPADEALMRYVSGMANALAIRSAFNTGKAFNIDESVGGIVNELLKSGKITYKEEAFIRKMLKARLNYARTAPMVALLKNFGYLGTMNSFQSAVTQIGDLYANFYKYGFGTAMKALFGKSEVTKEDLHLDSIWEEFSDESWSSIAVNKLFKVIGLNKLDEFGKNTAINGAWQDIKKRLQNNDISLLEDVTAAFGSRAKSVLEDIKNNNITEDVKLLLWTQLADTQPIGKSGVPVGYLNNPHGRLLYQLKTYTINQLSLFYADGVYKINKGIATKNKKLFLEGVGKTAKLALLLTAFNAGADVLKNLIMGRKIEISDTLLSNMLWNIGVSKYTFYRGQRDGYARALLENYLMPPQISMGDDAYMDIKKIATGKRKPSDTIAVTYVPFGRMWYWWFGGGRTQEKKKGNKPFQVEF